jgi:hypothetical protein
VGIRKARSDIDIRLAHKIATTELQRALKLNNLDTEESVKGQYIGPAFAIIVIEGRAGTEQVERVNPSINL